CNMQRSHSPKEVIMCVRMLRNLLSAMTLPLGAAVVLAIPLPALAAAGPEKGAPLETVRVSYNPGTILRLYAAFERETFAKHGLKIDLIRFESGAAASAAFAAGSVDIGFTGIPGFVS